MGRAHVSGTENRAQVPKHQAGLLRASVRGEFGVHSLGFETMARVKERRPGLCNSGEHEGLACVSQALW